MVKKKLTELGRIVLVSDPGGEWEGLYIDGELVEENHSVSAGQVVDALGGVSYELNKKQDAHLAEDGSLPATLVELEKW